jgi:hypothetical protein
MRYISPEVHKRGDSQQRIAREDLLYVLGIFGAYLERAFFARQVCRVSR